MSEIALPPTVAELMAQFPDAPIIESRYDIPADDFAAQKAKQEARQSDGGAIGVIWLDDGKVALVGRTQIHAGWALPGGTVEKDESYVDTFEREMLEEVGVHIDPATLKLMVLERRTWTSPDQEQLHMNMAVFEADALPGETVRQTQEADEEGLTVQAFSVNELPENLIFADKDKIMQSAERRQRSAA